MSEPNSAAQFMSEVVFAKGALGTIIPERSAAEELLLLKDETSCAVVLLQYFRDRVSQNPKADLRAAFEHVDTALAHSRLLRQKVNVNVSDDLAMLHLSMQHFQTVLSDIPQISYLTSAMIDSFLDVKDELIATRHILMPVQM